MRVIRPASYGFTIMEVMVAIMLLAVSIVAIFGAQFSAIATTRYAHYSTHAVQLAQCRMSEIELEILTEDGFEETDVESSGDCCELLEGEDMGGGENIDGVFICTWEIKIIEMPDIATLMAAGGGADGGVGGGLDAEMQGIGGAAGMGMGMGDMGGEGDMGGMGMMGDILSSFGPMITDMLREGIRRVTVTVEWDQGSRHREFMLSQYLTHPSQGPLQLLNSAADAQERMDQAAEDSDVGLPPVM
jgi:prepilin-type N-terminal cleavage/methylation domain-containing protein